MMTLIRSALHGFRGDRGDADPLMTVVSVAISAFLAAIVAGALTLVITTGATFTSGQAATSSSQQLTALWQRDTENASAFYMQGTTTAIFYTYPDDLPGGYLSNANDGACTKTTWTWASNTLTVVEGRWNNNVCDRTQSTLVPNFTSTVLSVANVTTFTVTASNYAGRDLHWDSTGTEVGMTSTNASLKSTVQQQVAGDASTNQWAFKQPAAVTLTGVIESGAVQRVFEQTGETSIMPNLDAASV
ncbi:hypothetical protein [Curtobacterium sp. MCBD17_040]|uniref:hypothetical protein n=1 Tax=Curtobacterium sp. MCBD17_040 TaxID=2175674 RepID=UPI0011B8046F|nr:hypothetical protein [Curtobacterium sp. MCBD17_040]WIB65634.1 hypothetical protein DEI94_16065 [Curtobacterium sp. MCBD17_040]